MTLVLTSGLHCTHVFLGVVDIGLYAVDHVPLLRHQLAQLDEHAVDFDETLLELQELFVAVLQLCQLYKFHLRLNIHLTKILPERQVMVHTCFLAIWVSSSIPLVKKASFDLVNENVSAGPPTYSDTGWSDTLAIVTVLAFTNYVRTCPAQAYSQFLPQIAQCR